MRGETVNSPAKLSCEIITRTPGTFSELPSELPSHLPAAAPVTEHARCLIFYRYVHEVSKWTCLVQHEYLHGCTADEHTLVCIDKLDALAGTDNPKLVPYQKLFEQLEDPLVLYLALLLHDTGKAVAARPHSE